MKPMREPGPSGHAVFLALQRGAQPQLRKALRSQVEKPKLLKIIYSLAYSPISACVTYDCPPHHSHLCTFLLKPLSTRRLLSSFLPITTCLFSALTFHHRQMEPISDLHMHRAFSCLCVSTGASV